MTLYNIIILKYESLIKSKKEVVYNIEFINWEYSFQISNVLVNIRSVVVLGFLK